jgi:hypothetical protein
VQECSGSAGVQGGDSCVVGRYEWLVEVLTPLDSLIAQSIIPPVRALFTWVPYLPLVSIRLPRS